jgi:hypothetical protein
MAVHLYRIALGIVLLTAATGALAQGEWSPVTSSSATGDNSARHRKFEFEHQGNCNTRFSWDVAAADGPNTQPYFRVKLERWVQRNRVGTWQNFSPVCTVHRTERNATAMATPAGKYRVTIYYRDVKYDLKVEKR